MTNQFEEQHLPLYKQEGYAYLSTLPEVKQFLDTELFDSITMVRDRLIDADMVSLEYDVVAPKLMPHPRARLLEHGLVNRHNLLHSGCLEDGISQKIGYFGNRLRIALNFRSEEIYSDGEEQ